MSTNIRNTLLALTFAIIVPVSIYTALEIGHLNENEEILENAYREQLQSFIFSLNQFSSDLIDFYINQVESEWIRSEGKNLADSIFNFQNLSIPVIAAKTDKGQVIYDKSLSMSNKDTKKIDSIFITQSRSIKNLIRYKEANYVKPQPIAIQNLSGTFLNPILIVIGKNTPCLLFVDTELFINEIISPWTQQKISSEKFNVSIINRQNNISYLDDLANNGSLVETDSLWLFPNYEVGISLKGDDVSEILASRAERNLIALGLLISLMLLGFTLVFYNIRKEMRLSKAKSDFVANVSHEIKTPLALIHMFSETLSMGRVRSEEKKIEYYDIISKETIRLRNIVNKILSFNQIEADKKQYQFKKESPRKLIEEIVQSYSYHLSVNNFTHDINLAENDIELMIDKDSFSEVIINLIDNAIKYSEDNRYLKITSLIDSQVYIIIVEDHGIGISKENQKHVFDKFYRVTHGDRYTKQGTGLGLALVKNIIHAHNGEITLTSQLGSGSTFKISLPLNNLENE